MNEFGLVSGYIKGKREVRTIDGRQGGLWDTGALMEMRTNSPLGCIYKARGDSSVQSGRIGQRREQPRLR